ncbi:MAG: hypothetical protein AAF402_16510 [Pseudomonadota bacterium]
MNQQRFRRELVAREEMLRAASKEQAKASFEQAVQAVMISTGEIPQEYKIVDVVFAFGDASTPDKITSASNPFENLKTALKRLALEKGGDAVINCRFEHRITVIESSYNRAIEFIAYGTVVRRLPFDVRPCNPY